MVDESGELREGEEEEGEEGGALVHIAQYVQQAAPCAPIAPTLPPLSCTPASRAASQTAKGNFSTPAVECGHLHWSELDQHSLTMNAGLRVSRSQSF